MLLSIIIPIYNRGHKFDRCIKSIKKIKRSNVEIIIVNDGSTDNTQTICEKYAREDSRIRLINQENMGVSGARNTGISNSRGEYIAFVDSDDEITEEYNKMIDLLEKDDKYDLYAFDFFVKMKKNSRRHKRVLFLPGRNNKEMLYNNYLRGDTNSSCINFYCAEIIKKNKVTFPTHMKMGEDGVFNGRYLKYCENVYYINEIGYIYYLDDQENASYANKLSYLYDFSKIYEQYLEIYYSSNGLEYPNCTKYHINNVYGILKRHRNEMSREDKRVFRRTSFCKNLLSQNYKSWKHEAKKICVIFYLYLL